MSARFTLKKNERLKQKKLIETLFESNKEVYSYPIKIIYTLSEEQLDSKVKVGFSVSARNFKKAVDRNTLKRRMREAYRLNKNHLHKQFENSDKSLILMVLYLSKSIEDFQLIQTSMIKLIEKLTTKLEKAS